MRLTIIILVAVIISAGVSFAATAYILDRQWSQYVDQITREHEQQELGRTSEAYARGFWRGTYSLCFMMLYGDAFSCLRGVRAGYLDGGHLMEAPPGWDWFYVRYQGQVQ